MHANEQIQLVMLHMPRMRGRASWNTDQSLSAQASLTNHQIIPLVTVVPLLISCSINGTPLHTLIINVLMNQNDQAAFPIDRYLI